MTWVPQATWATNVHRPVTAIRHFQLEQPQPHDMPTAAA